MMRKSIDPPACGERKVEISHRRTDDPSGMGIGPVPVRWRKAVSAALAMVLLLTSLIGTTAHSVFAEDAVHGAPVAQPEDETVEDSETKKTSLTAVDDSFADDKWDLILNQPALFHRMTYTDRETGLYVHYNIFLPEKYDKASAYPLVLFLPDVTSTGTNPELPLVQGIGGLVWTAKEWQEQFPAIVVVPLYREAILDHVYGYTTTGYVALTKNLVGFLCSEYAVDSSRIYGTGQGMGCEAPMSIASEDPGFFTACMFVSGQWDVNRLEALKDQKFIFFTAEDDRGANRCAQRLMDRFAAQGVGYAYSIWNGDWGPYDRTLSGIKLTVSETGHYFVFWRTGTIVADDEELKLAEKLTEKMTLVNPAVHVASFNAAYRCVAVMEWLFSQAKVFHDVVK